MATIDTSLRRQDNLASSFTAHKRGLEQSAGDMPTIGNGSRVALEKHRHHVGVNNSGVHRGLSEPAPSHRHRRNRTAEFFGEFVVGRGLCQQSFKIINRGDALVDRRAPETSEARGGPTAPYFSNLLKPR